MKLFGRKISSIIWEAGAVAGVAAAVAAFGLRPDAVPRLGFDRIGIERPALSGAARRSSRELKETLARGYLLEAVGHANSGARRASLKSAASALALAPLDRETHQVLRSVLLNAAAGNETRG